MSRIAGFLSIVLTLFLAAAPPAAGGQGQNKKQLPKTVMRMYDIRELIWRMRDYPGPDVGDIEVCAAPTFLAPPQPSYAMVDAASLMDMIKRQVDPASWAPNRGVSIEERSGRLFVAQTHGAHRQIAALLGRVRTEVKRQLSVRALVVAVDARAATKLRKRGSRLFSAQEAGELVRAAGRRGLVAAPQLVCLNGQRSHVGALTRLDYVAGLRAEGPRAVPDVGTMMLGTVLDVRPILTCEGDAASVELRLSFGGDCRARRQRVSGFFTPRPARDAKGKAIPGAAPRPVAYKGTIELPDQASWAVRTNVTVPLGKYTLAAVFGLPRGAGAPRTAVVLLGVDAADSGSANIPRIEGSPAQDKPVQRIYDVRELTATLTDFPGPEMGQLGHEQGGGAVVGVPPPNCAVGPGMIQDMVKRAIEPASWGVGGTSIEEKNGLLIVVHKPAVHARISRFIAGLRPKVKKQVQVRALLVAAGKRTATGLCVRRPAALSDAEVGKLLAGGGRLVAEARITCHNTQRVNVHSGRQANRIIPSDGLPEVVPLRSGFVLDVRPVLSADQKAATLTVRVGWAGPPSRKGMQRGVRFSATPAVPLGKYVLVGTMKHPGPKGAPLLVLVRADASD